jgi:hypothetical protein
VSAPLLDRVDRDTEFLTGLIMALTFTCTLSVANSGNSDVRTAIFGALACNVAWGVVDGVMYLLSCLAQRGEDRLKLHQLQEATDPADARRILEDALPGPVTAVLEPGELESLRARIARLPSTAGHATLEGRDYLAALLVFTAVVASTVPVVLPLALIHDPVIALRVSNATAIGLLFFAGRALGRATGIPARRTGLSMVAIGVVLVGIAIVLGG